MDDDDDDDGKLYKTLSLGGSDKHHLRAQVSDYGGGNGKLLRMASAVKSKVLDEDSEWWWWWWWWNSNKEANPSCRDDLWSLETTAPQANGHPYDWNTNSPLRWWW